MTWYAVCEIATGRLVSVGEIVASPLPANLEAITLAGEPTPAEMWNEATKAFVPRPAKVLQDRLQNILDHPDYGDDIQALWAGLSAANRTRLRNGLIRLLGAHRWRTAGESLTIGGDVKDA